MFSEIGYYGTNTQDIAKRAGVSTGIVYGYFKDKRDILICVLKIYIETVSKPLMDTLKKLNKVEDLSVVAPELIDVTINIHENNAKLHNTLHSLAPADEAVTPRLFRLKIILPKTFRSY